MTPRPPGDDGAPEPTERLAAVAAASRAGATAEEAWLAWAGAEVVLEQDGAPPLSGPEPVATEARAAARLAHRAGIPLADVLDALATVERSRSAGERAREAAMAGPRASARLLAWLPVAGLGFAAIVEPGVVHLVVGTPLGWVLLATGLGLTLAGRKWMAASLAAAEREGGKGDPAPGPVALCALLGAGVSAGLDVRSALVLTADAAGPPAAPLAVAAGALAAGEPWERAWVSAPAPLVPIARALEQAWTRGASPVAALAAAASVMVERDAARAQAAAAELGVRLSLPLALCLLPAFVVVGVVPLLLAVGGAVVADLGSVGIGGVGTGVAGSGITP